MSQVQVAERVVHLCITLRQLVFAVFDHCGTGRDTTVIFLLDYQPLAAGVIDRLQVAFPAIRFHFVREDEQIAAFSSRAFRSLPILARNLSLRHGRPRHWTPSWLAGQRFDRAYLYHSGPFMAKVLSGKAHEIVLREDGLSNYIVQKVTKSKAGVRLLAGLPPSGQVWGEERWVHVVEAERPHDLPVVVRSKGRPLRFEDLSNAVDSRSRSLLAEAFGVKVDDLGDLSSTALLLTQPIDDAGYCSTEQMVALYSKVVSSLLDAGYRVCVKQHPKDVIRQYPGTVSLPASLPSELLPVVTGQQFRLSVALCSTSLSSGTRSLAALEVQLLDIKEFRRELFANWDAWVSDRLEVVKPVSREGA